MKRQQLGQCRVEDKCLVQVVQSTCVGVFRPTSVDSRVTARSVRTSVPPGCREVAGGRDSRRQRCVRLITNLCPPGTQALTGQAYHPEPLKAILVPPDSPLTPVAIVTRPLSVGTARDLTFQQVQLCCEVSSGQREWFHNCLPYLEQVFEERFVPCQLQRRVEQ
eukprot:2567605-Rhodomonas_salina.2